MLSPEGVLQGEAGTCVCTGPEVHTVSALGAKAVGWGESIGLVWAEYQAHKRGLMETGPMAASDTASLGYDRDVAKLRTQSVIMIGDQCVPESGLS